MDAAVNECVDSTFVISIEYHRDVSDVSNPKVSRIWNLGFQSEQAPYGSAEDSFLLEFVEGRVVIDIEGDPRVITPPPYVHFDESVLLYPKYSIFHG